MARSSYRNKAENAFYQAARENGWMVSKRGWPDFWMVKDGRFAAVEVKPRGRMGLKARQREVMGAMTRAGIPCFIWSPDHGFERVAVEGGGGE